MMKLTDEQYADHVARLQKALAAAPASAYTHHDNSPQRQAARSQILDDAWAELGGDDIPKGRQGLILAGIPGSLKTTVRTHGEVPGVGPITGNFLPIDSDYFKGKIIDAGLGPSLPGFSPMEAAPLMHKESNKLAKALARRAYEGGTNVAWDYTLRHPHSGGSRLSEFDRYGYTGHGIYTHTDPQTALGRVSQRHRDDLDAYLAGAHRHGGRYVPDEIITGSVYGNGRVANRDHYNALIPHLATSQILDTSDGSMRRIGGISDQPDNVTNDYSLAEFLQWCAHNHKAVTRDNLAEYAMVSGMDKENYLDIYLFLANDDGMFRDAASEKVVSS